MFSKITAFLDLKTNFIPDLKKSFLIEHFWRSRFTRFGFQFKKCPRSSPKLVNFFEKFEKVVTLVNIFGEMNRIKFLILFSIKWKLSVLVALLNQVKSLGTALWQKETISWLLGSSGFCPKLKRGSFRWKQNYNAVEHHHWTTCSLVIAPSPESSLKKAFGCSRVIQKV